MIVVGLCDTIDSVQGCSKTASTPASCISLELLSQDEGVSSRDIVSIRYSLAVEWSETGRAFPREHPRTVYGDLQRTSANVKLPITPQ
jgi:hypothetical protein